jgi:hypothetical protein
MTNQTTEASAAPLRRPAIRPPPSAKPNSPQTGATVSRPQAPKTPGRQTQEQPERLPLGSSRPDDLCHAWNDVAFTISGNEVLFVGRGATLDCGSHL